MKKITIAGDHVTLDEVHAAIEKETYVIIGRKITVCHLTLVNGHEVTGQSGVVNPDNFDREIGESIAKENALSHVWSHLGSILQDRLSS
jgi:hypothetical protein